MGQHHVPCGEIHRVTVYEHHRQQLQLQHLQLTLLPCHHALTGVKHHDDLKEDILLGEDIHLLVGILLAEDNPVEDTLAAEGTLEEDNLAAEDTLEEDNLAGEDNLAAEGKHRVDIHDDHQNDQPYHP